MVGGDGAVVVVEGQGRDRGSGSTIESTCQSGV